MLVVQLHLGMICRLGESNIREGCKVGREVTSIKKKKTENARDAQHMERLTEIMLQGNNSSSELVN